MATKELRILLADDHPFVRSGFRAILEEQPGWCVCGEAADGQEAIKLTRELKPEVLIMDLGMPNLGGLEAARQIRKTSPFVEILIISMHCSEQLVADVMAAGARGYLLKTDTPRMLIAAVESAAERRPFFNPSMSGGPRSNSREIACAAQGITPRLTPREREVVTLLAAGNTNKDVAQRLGISVKTADVHRTNIMRRLNFHSVSELVRYAIRERIIEP